ncbi:MAG: prepilin-type N-terminal cleavage/methylation domain-containing protein [Acidimicrobiia bacterium]
MHRRARSDDGFTLVELMVVVLVIAILLAVAVPQFLGAKARAHDGAVKSNLRSVLSVASSYAAANAGLFPNETQLANEAADATFVAATAASTGSKVISVSGASGWLRAAAMSGSGSCVRMLAANGKPPVYTTSSSGSCQASYGVVSTFAGSGSGGSADGTGTAASFIYPTRAVFDSQGNLFVADSANNMIRKVTPAGVVTTFAGAVTAGTTNATGTAARFNFPIGIAVDATDNLYVADSGNNRVRKITPAGVVTTLAGSSIGYVNGTGTAARFSGPMGLAVDTSGNVFVADHGNNRIRMITPTGVVTTFAGSGTIGWADGTGTAMNFNRPYDIAVAPSGDFYIADSDSQRIRKMTPAGVVTTVAGSGSVGSADGTGSAASFNYPYGIAVDASGMIWVSDTYNGMIRQVTPDGVVTTYAGAPANYYTYVDGVGPIAGFSEPWGLAAAADGTVFVLDTASNRIRKIS